MAKHKEKELRVFFVSKAMNLIFVPLLILST